MHVYLVQHGEAEPKEVNPERPLSAVGRENARRVAAFAGRLGIEVHQIRHSGKARAEQTAAILGEALTPPGGVIAVAGLAPNDAVEPVAGELRRSAQPIMLVGHLPFLARLAGELLVGDPERAVVRFRYAAIVCLAREGADWQVAWVLTPEMARHIV